MPKTKAKASKGDKNEVQCPHCKLWSPLPLDINSAGLISFAVKGPVGDFVARFGAAQRQQLDEANAWVDLICPQPGCKKEFHYNLRSGEVKP